MRLRQDLNLRLHYCKTDLQSATFSLSDTQPKKKMSESDRTLTYVITNRYCSNPTKHNIRTRPFSRCCWESNPIFFNVRHYTISSQTNSKTLKKSGYRSVSNRQPTDSQPAALPLSYNTHLGRLVGREPTKRINPPLLLAYVFYSEPQTQAF